MRPFNSFGGWVQLDNLEHQIAETFEELGKPIETHWQAQSGVPQNNTVELLNVSFSLKIPSFQEELNRNYRPTQPWADEHFDERVSRIPHNPPPSASQWRSSAATKAGVDESRIDSEGRFSHTYPERFWPKQAWGSGGQAGKKPNRGIRYPYGDLDDVVSLLAREPYTRQAYLPIWFPEDTGAVPGERVPCTLGYHFILRDGKLHCFYPIRSCDFLRHFRNDLYFAGRLTQWIIEQLEVVHDMSEERNGPFDGGIWEDVIPGNLNFHAVSLHIFDHEADRLALERILK